MVVVHFPPPSRSIAPQFLTLASNDILIRIFDPTKYDATAISFRNYGPISRFDHHLRYPQRLDPDRSIIYAGCTLSCCIVEIFGTGGIVRLERQQIAFITLKDTLKLLDLRGSAAMAAGTVAALSSITQRDISQAWGKYFYENPQLYDKIDGLLFAGAHNGEDAIALYERAESKLASARIEILPLDHPDLRDGILSIANNHGLIVK